MRADWKNVGAVLFKAAGVIMYNVRGCWLGYEVKGAGSVKRHYAPALRRAARTSAIDPAPDETTLSTR